MQLLVALAYGLAWSSLIAWFALRRGSLSRSGAFAAVAIGTSIYAGGGGAWFAALVVFFATSTLLGKVGRGAKERIKRDYEKGDTRDAAQAFSNGGVAALCALGMAVHPHTAWAGAFLGALATANGDTWATELGVLSRREPVSLLRFRRVPRGTSGAVSALGLLATVLGGLAIGLVPAFAPRAFALPAIAGCALSAATGALGSLMDSLLGATLQAIYHCPRCDRLTESRVHACGASTTLIRGHAWFGNDAVNLAATLTGALLGALIAITLA